MYSGQIIDTHAHIFPSKISETASGAIGEFYNIKMSHNGTVEQLLKSGSRIGVRKYLVHSTATKAQQVRPINEFISEACRDHREFIGFGTLYPGMPEIDTEIDRIIESGLKGIKLHPDFQRFNIDDDRMLETYGALEGRLPVLFHVGDDRYDFSSPKRLRRVIDMFPRLTVIAAHFGGYKAWDEGMEYLSSKDIYFDTSSTLWIMDKERAKNIIHKIGAHKFLFGTDYPMWDHEDELKRFLNLGLSEEENRMILWENAERLLLKK